MNTATIRTLTQEVSPEVLAKEVAKHLSGHIIEEPIDKEGAARFLKIHVKTLERKLKSGAIPTKVIHRIDGLIYFFPSELNQFIKSL